MELDFSIILTLLFLLIIWLVLRKLNKALANGDIFSPLNILFYSWIVPFALSLTNLSKLQSGIEFNALVLILVCTFILFTTCFIAHVINKKHRHQKIIMVCRHEFRVNVIGILSFYTLTLVALCFAEFSGRDMPLLLYLSGGASDSSLHTAGKDSKLQVLAFGIHAASIAIFYLYVNEERKVRRFLYLTLSLSVIVIGILKASKCDILIPILSYSTLIYYHLKSKDNSLSSNLFSARELTRRFYVFFIIFSIFVLFSVITSIRLDGVGNVGGYRDLIQFRYSEEICAFPSEVISLLYGYSSLGFQNFSNVINTHETELRLGTSLFRPILSAVMMGDLADSMSVPVADWNVVSDAANTGTFLTPLYFEGGAYGCMLGSLIYGLLVNFFYMLARQRRQTVGWQFAYISLIFPWSWLFFTNAFSVLSIYINVFYVLLISALFFKFSVKQKNTNFEAAKVVTL